MVAITGGETGASNKMIAGNRRYQEEQDQKTDQQSVHDASAELTEERLIEQQRRVRRRRAGLTARSTGI
jgi:hypothetical protein